MSAKAIESGQGGALGPLLRELLLDGKCPWESSRGRGGLELGVPGRGQRGSGFWPGAATPGEQPWCSGPIKSLPPGPQPLALCSQDSPLVLGLPLSVFSLVHLQEPLIPLGSASSEVPSLH